MLKIGNELHVKVNTLFLLFIIAFLFLPTIYLYIEIKLFFFYVLILFFIFLLNGIPSVRVIKPLYSDLVLITCIALFSVSAFLSDYVSGLSLMLLLMYAILILHGVDFSNLMDSILQAFFVFIICGFVFSLLVGDASVCSSNGLRFNSDFLNICSGQRYSGFFKYPIDNAFVSLLVVLYFYFIKRKRQAYLFPLYLIIFYLALLSESRTMIVSFFISLYFLLSYKNKLALYVFIFGILSLLLFGFLSLDIEYIIGISDRFAIWFELFNNSGRYSFLFTHNFFLYALFMHNLLIAKIFVLFLFILWFYVLFKKYLAKRDAVLLYFVFFTGLFEVYMRLDMLSLGTLVFFSLFYSDRGRVND